jgi:opacity protein-like surface antigen
MAVSFAQENQRFTFDLGAGFTQGIGTTGRSIDNGWDLQAGVGYNFAPRFGVKLDLGYSDFGINGTTLATIGVPDGAMHAFSATLDPVIHTNLNKHFDFYITGGGGIYHRYTEFTQPSTAIVPGFYPYYGFYPTAVPVSQILGSYSSNKPGVDIGIGVQFGTKFQGKFFAEAKYNHVFDNISTNYLPVTFGFRW